MSVEIIEVYSRLALNQESEEKFRLIVFDEKLEDNELYNEIIWVDSHKEDVREMSVRILDGEKISQEGLDKFDQMRARRQMLFETILEDGYASVREKGLSGLMEKAWAKLIEQSKLI